MASRDSRLRRASARLEALVVLLLLFTLVGILLPGCQRQRVPSQRGECSNNLRNIGFAMQNYDAVTGHFPCEFPQDNPDYPTGPCPSFYSQLCDNLELTDCLIDGDPTKGAKPAPKNQVRVFLCPTRRSKFQVPGGRDYGYLKSNSQITAVLDTPKLSAQELAEKRGTATTAVLGHVWVPPIDYGQKPANPQWDALYPAHAMTNSSQIYADTDPAGSNALGSPHLFMPTLFADAHIGQTPLSYPQLALLFSIVPDPSLKNVP
jgi:hypothetical protein